MKAENKKLIDWLLDGDPWVRYQTKLELLNEPKKSLKSLKSEIITHPQIQQIIKELTNWPGKVLNSHRSAAQSFHKLSFLADLGLTKEDKEIDIISKKVMKHISKEGLFELSTNIPKHFGGSGKDEWAWALCDAPLILYSLLKFGYKDEKVLKGVKYILTLIRDNGWPCKVSDELGKFRGPGKKDDPCPFATLACLKMLTQVEDSKNSKQAKIGVECLLNLWQNSKKLHPYIFYMGNDFRKLKAPLFWYDILNVADVLSQFEFARKDKRFLDMIKVIKSKADKDGKYTAESVYREFKDYEFGQKKTPSRWVTLVVDRILKRT